jgi:hypothetical protein
MRLFLALALIWSTAGLALAQQKASVRLEVRNIGTAKKGSSGPMYYYWDGYGSYWSDYFRTTQLEAEVGTFAATPLKTKLQWFFIGKRTAGNERVLISRGQQNISVVNGPAQKFKLVSQPVHSVEIRSSYYGYRYSSGVKPEGWVVRVVTEDNTTLAIRSSPVPLADLFRDPAYVEALIKNAKGDKADEFDN